MSFEAVLQLLKGGDAPFDDEANKTLHFLLTEEQGCDATVSSSGLWIQYPRKRWPAEYIVSAAPGLVAKLYSLLGQAPKLGDFRGKIPGSTLARVNGQPAWGSRKRWLWLHASTEEVRMQVRPVALFRAQPLVAPSLLEWEPTSTEIAFPTLRPCPECGVEAASYKLLSDGSLVCRACGCSFDEDSLAHRSGHRT